MKTKLWISILLFSSQIVMSQWAQIGANIDGVNSGDRYGSKVSMDATGDRVAVAAYNYSSPTKPNHEHGLVRVFENTNGSWVQLGQDIVGENSGDEIGFSLSLSGDGQTVAIGSIKNSDVAFLAGQVRVFSLVNGIWVQKGSNINGDKLNSAHTTLAGYDVSINHDGTVVAVGCLGDYDDIGNNEGFVKIYESTGGVWVQTALFLGEGASHHFGGSISMNAAGTRVLVNSISYDYAKVYEKTTTGWVQLGQTITGLSGNLFSNGEKNTYAAISDDGTTIAISQSSDAKVYRYIGGVWIPIGAYASPIFSTGTGGKAIALNGDGSVMVIGDRAKNGANGEAMKVFSVTTDSFLQIGNNVFTEESNTWFGVDVAINNDGTKLIVGAELGEKSNGTVAGYASVYENTTLLSIKHDQIEGLTIDVKNGELVPNQDYIKLTVYNMYGQQVFDKKLSQGVYTVLATNSQSNSQVFKIGIP